MGQDGDWRWSFVSLDLMDIWDRIQGVRPSPSVEDRWVWVLGIMIVFRSPVRGRLFVLIVVGLAGRVYYGVGKYS